MGFLSFFDRKKVLYFPGCTTYYKNKEGFELYKKIFSKLGINYSIFDKNLCCGWEIMEAGYDLESRKLARKNYEIFTEENIKEIITNSPECYKMFLKNYKEMLPNWDIEVKNIWEIILNRLKKKNYLIKNLALQVVTFHDCCYLGRHSGIYNEPRKILEAIGYEIKEMTNNREESFCCGSCGGLPVVNKQLANKIAKERILQAKRIKINKMIVCSFDNYNLLKDNNKDSEIEILELSEVLALALGIKEIEKDEEKIEDEEDILLETKANMRFSDELREEDYYDSNLYDR